MALAQVLSAVRELILDQDIYPAVNPERLATLRERHPELSKEELEDLAKIPVERLSVYTTSIFAGERSLLQHRFPITFALIERAFEALGKPFDSVELIKTMHRDYPWRSAEISDLIENFRAFVGEQLSDACKKRPEISDIATFESARCLIERAPDDSFTIAESLTVAEIAKLSVGEILDLRLFIPKFVRIETFSHRCLELARLYHETDALPETLPAAGNCPAMIGRDRDGDARWTEGNPLLIEIIAELPRSEYLSISKLAEVFSSRGTLSEAESAQIFFRDLLLFSDAGSVLITR